jgi:cytochrome c oxidase subunit 2
MINLLKLSRPAILLCLLISVASIYAEDHPVPDEFIDCTVCHGTLFRGNVATGAPRLLGLSNWYIASQLESFSKGWRGTHVQDLAGMEMRPMAAALTNKSQNEVSKLIGELPNLETTGGDPVNSNSIESIERGRQLYSSCSTCHGEKGRGNKLMSAPNLVVQNGWYLVLQLNNYRNDIRGFEHSDVRGLQMRAATSSLKADQDVFDVVEYIKSMHRD